MGPCGGHSGDTCQGRAASPKKQGLESFPPKPRRPVGMELLGARRVQINPPGYQPELSREADPLDVYTHTHTHTHALTHARTHRFILRNWPM